MIICVAKNKRIYKKLPELINLQRSEHKQLYLCLLALNSWKLT